MQHAQSIGPTEERTNDSCRNTWRETWGARRTCGAATAPESDRARSVLVSRIHACGRNAQPSWRRWPCWRRPVWQRRCPSAPTSGPSLPTQGGCAPGWNKTGRERDRFRHVRDVAQIVIAFFPGEPLETGRRLRVRLLERHGSLPSGDSALGTAVVMLAVRTLGMRVVHLFFSAETDRLRRRRLEGTATVVRTAAVLVLPRSRHAERPAHLRCRHWQQPPVAASWPSPPWAASPPSCPPRLPPGRSAAATTWSPALPWWRPPSWRSEVRQPIARWQNASRTKPRRTPISNPSQSKAQPPRRRSSGARPSPSGVPSCDSRRARSCA